MDIQSIRRAVLRTLIGTHHSSTRQFAIHINKPDGQINDMLANPPRKSFGERIARAIENKYPLPPGFFDDITNASKEHIEALNLRCTKVEQPAPNVVYAQFNSAITEVIQLMESVDEEAQRDILGAARATASEYRLKQQNSLPRAGKQ